MEKGLKEGPKVSSLEAEPFEDLLLVAKKKLIELFPDFTGKINSKVGNKLVEVFVGDALSELGLNGQMFHRLDVQRQKELLADKNLDDLFNNLPESLVNFYKDKINQLE